MRTSSDLCMKRQRLCVQVSEKIAQSSDAVYAVAKDYGTALKRQSVHDLYEWHPNTSLTFKVAFR